jgi:hypothetical protein
MTMHPLTISALRAAAEEYRRLAALPRNKKCAWALRSTADDLDQQCNSAEG